MSPEEIRAKLIYLEKIILLYAKLYEKTEKKHGCEFITICNVFRVNEKFRQLLNGWL